MTAEELQERAVTVFRQSRIDAGLPELIDDDPFYERVARDLKTVDLREPCEEVADSA